MITTVLITVENLKLLLSVATNEKTSAAGYIHYQEGKLWATDGTAMLFFVCDPSALTDEGVDLLPEGLYSFPKAELKDFIKGKKGTIKLDLRSFSHNSSMTINGCSFLKGIEYRELGIKEFRAWGFGVRKAFGKNIAFRYRESALEFSTGSDTSYTVATSQEIEWQQPVTGIVTYRTAYADLLLKMHWNQLSVITEGKPIVFASPGKMYFVVMPFTARSPSLSQAFSTSIEVG